MKKAISVLFLVLACLSARADYTIISLTVTNTPTNGYTATINGKVITWTNTVFDTSVQVANTNTIGAVTTNLLNQLVASRVSGVQPTLSGTNAILLQSFAALTVSVSTNWATLSTTNVVTTNATTVLSRFNNYTVLATRTNVASGLVSDLDTYSTTAFSAASPTLANHMALSTAQTVTGAKNFSGANVYSNAAQVFSGGTITNSILSNCVPALTNGYASNLILTNGQNFGNAFRSPGGGLGSEQFGTASTASHDGDVAVGNEATATGPNATALGAGVNALAASSVAVGFAASANGRGSISIGEQAETDAEFGIAIGYLAISAYSNSIAIGAHASPDQAFQIKLGTPLYSTSIPGGLQVDGSISNATFAGSVKLNNELIVTSFNNTSLANGNNAGISLSTNAYVTIASGPSALFTIAGIAGGVAGRVVTLENTTGQSMVLANESGLDATAANRIKTGYTADVTYTNNPGTVTLRYNGTLSRWVVISKN